MMECTVTSLFRSTDKELLRLAPISGIDNVSHVFNALERVGGRNDAELRVALQ